MILEREWKVVNDLINRHLWFVAKRTRDTLARWLTLPSVRQEIEELTILLYKARTDANSLRTSNNELLRRIEEKTSRCNGAVIAINKQAERIAQLESGLASAREIGERRSNQLERIEAVLQE